MKSPRVLFCLAVGFVAATAFAQSAGKSILELGDFETPGQNWEYAADGWKRTGYWGTDVPPNDVKRIQERGNAFIRVTSGAGLEKGTVLCVLQEHVLLNPAWKSIIVRFRSRLPDLETGVQKWHTARVQLEFFDADGKSLKSYPSVNAEPSGEWVKTQGVLNVPAGAHSVGVQFGFWNALGTFDVDDLELIPNTK